MSYLSDDYSDLEALAARFRQEYSEADPFPNIHFNNFFDSEALERVLVEFPDLTRGSAIALEHRNSKKLATRGEERFGPHTIDFTRFLNSERFLRFLETLTSMERPLIPDPYFFGGGFHQIRRDGFLKIHADFNKHDTLGLDRRLNVLIYLNKDWKPEFGGNFELWDKDMKACVKSVPPTFNTLAIFSTTDSSFHGHPDPLSCPPDRARRSLALYYYTNGRPEHEIAHGNEVHSTLYAARPGEAADRPAISRRVKTVLKDFTPPALVRMLKRN